MLQIDKVVLITGCSSGFGYETAKLLAAQGYRVYASVRDPRDLSIFEGNNPKPILLDITWPQERINTVVNQVLIREGKIDVLVNNSGFGFLGTIGSFAYVEVKDQFETNFFGQFKMIKAVLPYMRKRRKGLIINISTISGLVTTAFYGVYSASKFALEALTTSLRNEESINGIMVVAINPSSHKTKFWENVKFPKEGGFINQKIREMVIKLKHFRGDPKAVAKTILKVIRTKSPHKNYLVGFEASIIYFMSRITPQWLIDWVGKMVIHKISSTQRLENGVKISKELKKGVR